MVNGIGVRGQKFFENVRIRRAALRNWEELGGWRNAGA
jgi:hypothetical protein